MRLIDFYQDNKKLYDDIQNIVENCCCYYVCGRYTIYKKRNHILTMDILTTLRSGTCTIFCVVFTIKHSDKIIYEISGYLPVEQIKKECFFLSLLCKYNKLSAIKKLSK